MTLQGDDQWRDTTLFVRHLAKELNHGRLLVWLGSGISTPFGVPQWGELVDRLFRSTRLRKPPTLTDVTAQTEYLRKRRFGRDPKGFLTAVTRALYMGVPVKFDELRANAALDAISLVVDLSARRRLAHVVTFNFDDLLERYLGYRGIAVHSVGEEKHWSTPADVCVLHPHGVLPSNGRPPSGELTFDRMSYTKVIGDEARPWRQLLLSLVRSRTVLFIGVSGDDNHMDSLIVRCEETHVKTDGYWGVWITTGDRAREAFWRGRRVFPKLVKDYEKGLPTLLYRVCQEAASLRSA